MIYVTSDLHLGHRNVIDYNNRPFESLEKMHYGSYMLHGHIHSTGDYNLQNRERGVFRYDVGVDANQFTPVSLEQIVDFFNSYDEV